jgi:lipopolysaccharide export system permease protein
MKKYSSYIFYRVSTAFLGLILIIISLIWFSKAIQFVKFITDYGISLSQFLSLFVLILPWLSLFLIPIALFITTLMVYNRLINNNEITILKNSGLSKFYLCFPMLPLVAICVVISFAISFYFMPYANKNLRLARMEFQNNYSNLAFKSGTFESVRFMTIYVKDRIDNKLTGILVHDLGQKEYSFTATAKSGAIMTSSNSAILYMQNGTLQKFNYKTNKTDILKFDSYSFNLGKERKDNLTIRWRANERYLKELIHPELDSSLEELKKYHMEFHQRIITPLFSAVLTIIALSLILRGQFNRRGNLNNILLAILIASIFIVIAINLNNLPYVLISYLNLALFSAIGLYMGRK